MSVQQKKKQEQSPPPAYAQHDEAESLQLPSVPTHNPSATNHEHHLPGIKSLDLPAHGSPPAPAIHAQLRAESWGFLPPPTAPAFPSAPAAPPRHTVEGDVGSPMDTTSVASTEDHVLHRASSTLSMDDPDVRLAAEALSGLGNPDFMRSPSSRSVTRPREPPPEPEPLLSLITSNHPWLGGTITNSISAYAATKSYSPRFVKSGAEFLERKVGSHMVNTVSSVGRRTGVERGIRYYLGEHRRPSDLEQADAESAHKRRRVATPDADVMEVDSASHTPRLRGGSQSSFAESLPAYDDHKSPSYEEAAAIETDPASQDRRTNWSTQLIMTTSGLGVALSDASLRSLKHCLSRLRAATTNIDSAMHALKLLLEEYDQAVRSRDQSNAESDGTRNPSVSENPEREEQIRKIAELIKSKSTEIWQILQNVVQVVNRYTGGALPQNASQVVRTQLLSVPQRWRLASQTSDAAEASSGEHRSAEVRTALRMLAFAKEGLDMMTQISTVVDGTVQSAEAWLARMGRKPAPPSTEAEKEKSAFPPPGGVNEKR